MLLVLQESQGFKITYYAFAMLLLAHDAELVYLWAGLLNLIGGHFPLMFHSAHVQFPMSACACRFTLSGLHDQLLVSAFANCNGIVRQPVDLSGGLSSTDIYSYTGDIKV